MCRCTRGGGEPLKEHTVNVDAPGWAWRAPQRWRGCTPERAWRTPQVAWMHSGASMKEHPKGERGCLLESMKEHPKVAWVHSWRHEEAPSRWAWSVLSRREHERTRWRGAQRSGGSTTRGEYGRALCKVWKHHLRQVRTYPLKHGSIPEWEHGLIPRCECEEPIPWKFDMDSSRRWARKHHLRLVWTYSASAEGMETSLRRVWETSPEEISRSILRGNMDALQKLTGGAPQGDWKAWGKCGGAWGLPGIPWKYLQGKSEDFPQVRQEFALIDRFSIKIYYFCCMLMGPEFTTHTAFYDKIYSL